MISNHEHTQPQGPASRSPIRPSEASVARLVRSSLAVYGAQPTEQQVRAWAAGQTQRAVSDRITAIEADPRYSAQRNRRVTPVATKLDAVPEGRYAVDHDGQLRFYKVDKPTEGRWKGYTFIKEGVGGWHNDLVWHRMAFDRREAAAEAIIAAGYAKAGERYGQEVGECYACGRTLTDEQSRLDGIGPVCKGKREGGL